MLEIRDEHLDRFRKLKEHFLKGTTVPREGNWKSKTNNEIWLEIVKQVIVVGRSEPAEKLERDVRLKNEISYEELLRTDYNEEEMRKKINRVLREVGTRYHNKKTDALVNNFKMLSRFLGGPKDLLRRLSEYDGSEADKWRIEHMMRFKYIKSKGARDFLMELGLVRNAIALDTRIQDIFDKIGIQFPKEFVSNPQIYDEVERDILERICKPLGVTGVELDRMLYQNKDRIVKMRLHN